MIGPCLIKCVSVGHNLEEQYKLQYDLDNWELIKYLIEERINTDI